MPKCMVFGCKNVSEDGFIMKRFPNDEERKLEWLRNLLREDWKPHPDALVCEAHFPPQMWEESRDDFIRVLKHDAVPTLFEYNGDRVPSIPYSKARKCSAFNCYNRDGFFRLPNINLYKFPLKCEDEELVNRWKLATNDPNFTLMENSFLCSDHFTADQFIGKQGEQTLVPGAYPTISKIVKSSKEEKSSLNIINPCKKYLDPYIEIQGLEPNKQGDLNADIMRISTFFGVELSQEDIQRCFIFKKKNVTTGERTFDTIIVKFMNLFKKSKLISAYKKSEKTLMDSTRGSQICLSDEISPANKKLLMITEKIPVNDMKTINSSSGDNNPSKTIIYKKVVKKIVPKPPEILSSDVVAKSTPEKEPGNISIDMESLENIDNLPALETEDETPESFSSQQEQELVNKALESFGLHDNASDKIEGEFIPHTDDGSKDKGASSTNEQLQQNSTNNAKQVPMWQLDSQSMEIEIKTDEDEDIVDNSVANDGGSSSAFTESNRSSQDLENQLLLSPKEEVEIKEEPESSLDSGTYNMLIDCATECKVEVKLERLDQEMVEQYGSVAFHEKTKPFKKRFSVDHSEEVLESSSNHSVKKRMRKAAGSTSVSTTDNLYLKPIVRSRRKVVKPQKYKEFDCSFVRTSSQGDNRKLAKHTGTGRKTAAVEVTEGHLEIKKTFNYDSKKTVFQTENRRGIGQLNAKKTAKTPEPKKDKNHSPEKVCKKKKKELGLIENNLTGTVSESEDIGDELYAQNTSSSKKEVVYNTPAAFSQSISIPKITSVRSFNEQHLNELSSESTAVRPEENTVAPLTILHGVKPVTSSKSNNSSEGGIPVALTPFTIPASNYSPAECTVLNNFKLITNFEQLIGHLKEKYLLKSHVEDFLSKNFSNLELYKLMRCRDLNRATSKYSELQTKFALSLYLYSLECYKYLSSVFSLPSEFSFENLIFSTNYQPGFLKESLNFIKNHCKDHSEPESVNCYLVVDYIPLKKNVTWDEVSDTFIGYTQLFPSFDFENTVATQVVLVMLSSLNENLNIPLAYFPVDTVYPEFLASIIHLSVNYLLKIFIKIKCIVLDASDTSFSCAKLCGCSLKSQVVSTYSNYLSNFKVPFIFDTHHLGKEVRDCFSRVDIIGSKSGWVEWKYIQCLNEKLASKFSMCPELLPKTLTSLKLDLSLAEAVEELKLEGDTMFTCSKPTIMFIKYVDKVLTTFDYYRSRFAELGLKESSIRFQKWYSSEFCPYFRHLSVNSEDLKNHRKFNFVNGCFFNMNSVCLLYEKTNLKKNHQKRDLPKYKLTLDPIDLFCYRIFTIDHNIVTPDCLSFRLGLERYMGLVKSSVLPLEEIPPLLADFRSDKRNHRFVRNVGSLTGSDRSRFYVDYLYRSNLKMYKDCILMLISNLIKDDVQSRISCLKCIEMLNHADEIPDSADHNYSSLDWQRKLALHYDNRPARASNDVFKIIQVCDKEFNQSTYSLQMFNVPTEKLSQLLKTRIKIELYENYTYYPFAQCFHPVFEDVFCTTHEYYLTTLIIEKYVQMRLGKLKSYCYVFT